MKKIILLVLFALFLLKPSSALAAKNFDISMQMTYTVNNQGITHVQQKISIKNLKDLIYTPSYSVNLGISHMNNVRVMGAHGALSYTITKAKGGNKKIEVTFDCDGGTDKVSKCLGQGKEQNFTLTLDTPDIAQKRGSVWQVSIPGIENTSVYDDLSTTISVPDSFGNPSVMKPSYTRPISNPLYFSKSELGKGGIYLLYGKSQVYSYSLTYHLSNPNLFPIKTEIALPPPTNYQDVTLNSLSPAPENVYRDQDGNWIAQYNLDASARMNVIAKGQVNVKPDPSSEELTNPDVYLKSLPYWDVSSSAVQKVAETLNTPQDIYNYVVGHLTYNYSKTSAENNRLGAKGVLENPKNAVCLEFTDLFVALTRAKGIPARAIEGYAYTNDQTHRPSSTVQDVLHAWPEYYDEMKKTWVMVDPTWGNTTGGMDYFTSFDYDHIAFDIKGISSTYPIPAGGYKLNNQSQDVHISFSNDTSLATTQRAVLASILPSQVFSMLPFSGKVTVKNIGNTSIRNKTVQVQSDVPLAQSVFNVDYLPPFGSKTFNLQFSRPPSLTNQKFKVTMQFDGASDSKIIQVQVFPLYGIVLLGGGICAVIIISIIALKSRRLPL